MAVDEPNEILQYIRIDPESGAVMAAPWRRDIMPFWLYFDEQNVQGPLQIPAVGGVAAMGIYKVPHASASQGASHGYTSFMPSNAQNPANYPLGLQSVPLLENQRLESDLGNPLLCKWIVCRENLQAGNLPNYTVVLRDMGDKTQFMNAPVHMQLFAGTALQPAGMGEPLFLPTRHTLQATFVNLGIAASMRMILSGQMFYTWSNNLMLFPNDREIMVSLIRRYLERRKYVYPFWLTTEVPAALAAYQTQDFEALVGDDGHFEATHIVSISPTALPFEFEVLDPDNGQTISNGKIDSEVATGTATFPQELPVPWLIPAGRRLIFKVHNRAGAANTAYIALRGKKVRAPFREWKTVLKDLEIPGAPQAPFQTQVSRPPDQPQTAGATI